MRKVIISSSAGATRFTEPSAWLYFTNVSGSCRSNPERVATKYDDQTRATIAAAVTSSSISARPTSHAQISPKATYVKVYALPETGIVDDSSA